VPDKSNANATTDAHATARGSNLPRWATVVAESATFVAHLAGSGSPRCCRSDAEASQARSPRRYTSTCTVLANAAQASSPASVTATASAVPTSMPTRRPIASYVPA
jgi:hypothetical protein